jgi:glycerol-3-phosphate acyltransferase PlsX
MADKNITTLALDVMGTDNGPGTIISGGLQAARDFGPETRIVLVGRRDLIKAELKKHRQLPQNHEVYHADEQVAMADIPAEAFRRKDTSIAVAVRLHREGKVDALVSPGNTGAVMGTAMLNLGRLRGVKRPAIASFFPAINKTTTIVLDVGANSECKPINLHQFAIMGSVMSTHMCRIKRPRIGLLSIGEEKNKGNDLILETYPLLEKDKRLNFLGNIEGRDILKGGADVVVTDGFVGNIILKFAESVEGFLTTSIRRQVSSNPFSRAGAILMSPFLRRLRNTFDYSEYGGVPLLGVNGICIICHGESSSKAIRKALTVARKMVHHQVNRKIESELLSDRTKAAASVGCITEDGIDDNRLQGEDNA